MNITVLQIMLGSQKHFVLSEQINRLYCTKHNYQYKVVHGEPLDNWRSTRWQKPLHLYEHIHDTTDDFTLYLDADAVFYSHELKIEQELIPRLEGKHILLASNCGGECDRWQPQVPNSGVILFRNTDLTKEILNYWNTVAREWYFSLYDLDDIDISDQYGLSNCVMYRYSKHISLLRDYYLMNGSYGQYIRHWMTNSKIRMIIEMESILKRISV